MSIIVGSIIIMVGVLYCLVSVKTNYDKEIDDRLQEEDIRISNKEKDKSY